MANWEPVASETLPEQVTPTEIRNVDQVTGRALPSGIIYYVRFTSVIDDPANVDAIMSVWAGWLNELNATPGVVSVTWVQDINASDQVVDTLTIVVDSTTNALLTATLNDVPTEENVSQWQQRVADARAALDQIGG